jgi:transposase
MYIGVDLRARTQIVCWCDTADGNVNQEALHHQGDDVRTSYAWSAAPAVVGPESSGYAVWFHQLLDELGYEVRVSDAFAIRQLARRREKNGRRDAELLWELLLRGDFPAGHVPCPPSREVLALLRYPHRLIRIRTVAKYGLQVVALRHRLQLGQRLFTGKGRQQLQALSLAGAYALQRERALSLVSLSKKQIKTVQ